MGLQAAFHTPRQAVMHKAVMLVHFRRVFSGDLPGVAVYEILESIRFELGMMELGYLDGLGDQGQNRLVHEIVNMEKLL